MAIVRATIGQFFDAQDKARKIASEPTLLDWEEKWLLESNDDSTFAEWWEARNQFVESQRAFLSLHKSNTLHDNGDRSQIIYPGKIFFADFLERYPGIDLGDTGMAHPRKDRRRLRRTRRKWLARAVGGY